MRSQHPDLREDDNILSNEQRLINEDLGPTRMLPSTSPYKLPLQMSSAVNDFGTVRDSYIQSLPVTKVNSRKFHKKQTKPIKKHGTH